MATGTQTFGLGETFAEPQVLPPPPVRHALLVFLVALAAILHIGTAGWNEIHNGGEGFYAGSARQMAATHSPLLPRSDGKALPDEPPMLHWLLLGSFQTFGASAAAARVPTALAFVATVALTFLIGERLADYWRGFVAGLIHLSTCGAYILGRAVTPEPLFAMFVAGAVLCAVAGYQCRRGRRLWFAAFWFCAGFAYLTRGAYALLFLGLIIGLPALCFRESRLRFRALFQWSGLIAFAAIVTPWLGLLTSSISGAALHGPWLSPFSPAGIAAQLASAARGEFLAAHLLWWFPAVCLVLPGALFAWRKIIRPASFDFEEAIALCWLAAAIVLPVLVASRQEYDSVASWSGFALFAACAWDRISNPLRVAGLVLVALVGTAAAIAVARGALVLPGLGSMAFQQGDAALLAVAATALAICCAAAAHLLRHQRETLAITALLVASVPIGLGAIESIARNETHLSFARVAHLLNMPEANGEVLFEGSRASASSLGFYLNKRFSLVDTGSPVAQGSLSVNQAVEKMGRPDAMFLIFHKERATWWQAQLTAHFHIYHQVTTCGPYVIVKNHP